MVVVRWASWGTVHGAEMRMADRRCFDVMFDRRDSMMVAYISPHQCYPNHYAVAFIASCSPSSLLPSTS